jgi:cyclopropane fatty-acyl-phospholipid synthase-like methyltransferase
LILQAEIVRPITERLLRQAGLKPGMRVLDLGCGIGDVSLLAAGVVGPSGLVVGVDQSPEQLPWLRAEFAIKALSNRPLFRGCTGVLFC